jgi:hypothetical protein
MNHHVVARAISLAPPARAGVFFARSNPLAKGDCFVGKSKCPPRNDIILESNSNKKEY